MHCHERIENNRHFVVYYSLLRSFSGATARCHKQVHCRQLCVGQIHDTDKPCAISVDNYTFRIQARIHTIIRTPHFGFVCTSYQFIKKLLAIHILDIHRVYIHAFFQVHILHVAPGYRRGSRLITHPHDFKFVVFSLNLIFPFSPDCRECVLYIHHPVQNIIHRIQLCVGVVQNSTHAGLRRQCIEIVSKINTVAQFFSTRGIVGAEITDNP